jgi:hypothetical protein
MVGLVLEQRAKRPLQTRVCAVAVEILILDADGIGADDVGMEAGEGEGASS